MGIDLGALIRGTAGGIAGYEQGKRQRSEDERKAMLEILQQKVLEQRIAEGNRPKPLPDAFGFDPTRGVVFNKQTGEIRTPTNLPSKPQTPKNPVTAFTSLGLLQYNDETDEWEPAKVAGGGATPQRPDTNQPLVTDVTGKRVPDKPGVRVPGPDRPPSAATVAAQDQLPTIEQAYWTLEEIETNDPRIGNRVIAKANRARQFSVGKVAAGIVGKLSGTRSDEDQKALTEQAIINSLTPEEAQWYAASKAYISGVIPALGGKQLTINEVITHGSPLFSTGEESDESLRQKREARRVRYQSVRQRAGVQGEVPSRKEPSARARALVGRVK